MTKLFLTACLAFLTSFGYGQSFPYRHFGMEEGLASNKTFDVLADAWGYIWISSENGIHRFDGHSFQIFNQSDGLKSVEIVEMCKDEKGNIWLEGFKTGLQLIRHNVVCTPDIKAPGVSQFKQMTYYKDDLYFINASHDKLVYKLHYGTAQPIQASPEAECLYRSPDGRLLAGGREGIFDISQPRPVKLGLRMLRGQTVYSLTQYGHTLWIGTGKGLLCISGNELCGQYKTPHPPTTMTTDHDGNLWFGMAEGGAGCILKKNNKVVMRVLDSTVLVSDVLTDRQNSVWITTYGSGVYQFANRSLLSYAGIASGADKSVLAIAPFHDSGLAVAFNDQILLLQNNEKPRRLPVKHLHINSLRCRGNSITCVALSPVYTGAGKIHVAGIPIVFSAGSAGWFDSDSVVYSASLNNIYKQKLTDKQQSEVQRMQFTNDISIKAYSIIRTGDSLWIATTGAVYIYADGRAKAIEKYRGIRQLIKDRRERVYLASPTGLIRLDRKLNIDTIFFSGQQIRCALVIGNEIWAGTGNGLLGYKDGTVIRLGKRQGLPDDGVNCMYHDGKFLWVGTDRGCCKMDIQEQWSHELTPPLRVFFTTIETPDDTLSGHSATLFFPSDISYIRFNFSSINFIEDNRTYHEYSLDDEKWLPVAQSNVTLTFPRYGRHSIRVRSRNGKSDWRYASRITFDVATPFTQTPSFGILIALSVAVLAWIIVWIKRSRRRKEAMIAREITELKHRALHAMMSPHFIFNSLSSVQYFVATKQEHNAHSYISKLASLIRINLSHSTKNDVTICEELDFLRLYLELEKVRFEDRIQYDFELIGLTAAQLQELKIPALLLQPLIENAIKHGILPSGKNGLIKIIIAFRFPLLSLTVEDNGVGYRPDPAAARHQSLALEVLETRISLRNRKKNTGNSFTIGPITEAGTILGTRATIVLNTIIYM